MIPVLSLLKWKRWPGDAVRYAKIGNSFMSFTATFCCTQAAKVMTIAPRFALFTELIFKLVSAALLLSSV